MKSLLDRVFGAAHNQRISRPARASASRRALRLENLEDRRLMARQAVLDFDGETLTAAQMSQGGWSNGALTVPSFQSLFTNARMFLDLNANGVVNGDDAQIAIDRIVAKVRQDYSPYNLSIRVGDQDDFQSILTDSQAGDVLVMITGGTNVVTTQGALGLSPWSDLGNEHEEISWVFGGGIIGSTTNAANFINRVARTISHEMGHAFGLGHIDSTPTGMEDARTHHLMNSVNRDFDHDFVFQDITYDTDVFDFAVQNSANHPEFNTSMQNSHQYLSHPDVLGPSAGSWVAALKPGELTVYGNNSDNNISVTPGVGNDWNISIGTRITLSFPLGFPRSFWLYSNMTVDANTPDIESVNPYDDALSKIKIYGRNGNDTLTVSNSITAATYAYGGAGNDNINGGGGHDYLYGEAGLDTIHGNDGNDRLFGGAAVDQLFGDAGDDHLYGASLGADDGAIDKLTGGVGRDRFYRKVGLWPFPVVADNILDFVAADDQIVLYF